MEDAARTAGPAIITLSEAGRRRLGDRRPTAVAAGPAGLVVPYAALVYDTDGSTWVFVQTEPLTYQRTPVDGRRRRPVTRCAHRRAPAGTQVVTVGAAELVGVETGIDGEE